MSSRRLPPPRPLAEPDPEPAAIGRRRREGPARSQNWPCPREVWKTFPGPGCGTSLRAGRCRGSGEARTLVYFDSVRLFLFTRRRRFTFARKGRGRPSQKLRGPRQPASQRAASVLLRWSAILFLLREFFPRASRLDISDLPGFLSTPLPPSIILTRPQSPSSCPFTTGGGREEEEEESERASQEQPRLELPDRSAKDINMDQAGSARAC